MIKNENYSIRRIENQSILKKSFLLFLDNFESDIKNVSKGILDGRIQEAAILFDVKNKESFEVVDVNFDDLKLIEVISNFKEVNSRLKVGQKLVFTGFELHLQNLVSVSVSGDNIRIVKKLPSQFNVVLGEGVLYVNYKAVSRKVYENLQTETA